ncbi:MAG TPA: ABC transporter permease [Anaerolineae bacterium]|nr:ABC transporter permease [Anaerolineae bacterium]
MRAARETSDLLAPAGVLSGISQSLRRRLCQIPDKYRAYLLAPPALLAFLCLWQLLVTVGSYPTFILPAPAIVFRKFVVAITDGTLLHHAWATVREVLLGLALGLSVATCLGYIFAKSKSLERLLSPYIVASQSMPIVALAPLLVIWFGFGTLSKVIVCSLTVFFPVLINTIVGLRSVDENLVDLMRSYGATRRQMFTMLEIPAALPVLLGGLKIGVTLSVIGAVVGEFVAADEGLGFLVNLSRGLFDTPMMFVALFALVIIALSLYGCVVLLESRLLSWRRIK